MGSGYLEDEHASSRGRISGCLEAEKLPLSESEKRRQLFKSVFSVWLHVNLFLKDNTLLEDIISNLIGGTVIPAMVQRLRFSINVQHLSHKFG